MQSNISTCLTGSPEVNVEQFWLQVSQGFQESSNPEFNQFYQSFRTLPSDQRHRLLSLFVQSSEPAARLLGQYVVSAKSRGAAATVFLREDVMTFVAGLIKPGKEMDWSWKNTICIDSALNEFYDKYHPDSERLLRLCQTADVDFAKEILLQATSVVGPLEIYRLVKGENVEVLYTVLGLYSSLKSSFLNRFNCFQKIMKGDFTRESKGELLAFCSILNNILFDFKEFIDVPVLVRFLLYKDIKNQDFNTYQYLQALGVFGGFLKNDQTISVGNKKDIIFQTLKVSENPEDLAMCGSFLSASSSIGRMYFSQVLKNVYDRANKPVSPWDQLKPQSCSLRDVITLAEIFNAITDRSDPSEEFIKEYVDHFHTRFGYKLENTIKGAYLQYLGKEGDYYLFKCRISLGYTPVYMKNIDHLRGVKRNTEGKRITVPFDAASTLVFRAPQLTIQSTSAAEQGKEVLVKDSVKYYFAEAKPVPVDVPVAPASAEKT